MHFYRHRSNKKNFIDAIWYLHFVVIVFCSWCHFIGINHIWNLYSFSRSDAITLIKCFRYIVQTQTKEMYFIKRHLNALFFMKFISSFAHYNVNLKNPSRGKRNKGKMHYLPTFLQFIPITRYKGFYFKGFYEWWINN